MTSRFNREYVYKTRIICIGNSLFDPDSAGPHVHRLLSQESLPHCVELIDGGLGGLNLLRFLEHIDNVIFIDAIKGFRTSPGITMVPLPNPKLAVHGYDHNAGISYLTTIAPQVLDCPMPECLLLGIEGAPTGHLCREAAELCLELISKETDNGLCTNVSHSPFHNSL